MKWLKCAVLFCLPFLAFAKAPPIAIEACASAQSGDSCRFSMRDHAVEGVCGLPPRQKTLVCMPERRGQNHNGFAGGNQNSERTAGGRSPRKHTTVQSDGEVQTVKANVQPIADNIIASKIQGKWRVLTANGISEHLTGAFPNPGNPNEIKEQDYSFRVPAKPELANKITPLGLHDFGLGLNGVPFDPVAAEWYLGDRNSGWQYEAMSGAVPLGLDENHAHVQPTGAYHYHALPTLLIEKLNLSSKHHSPLIGWAADGFPIYALYGYEDTKNSKSDIVNVSSSYRVKSGHRPEGGSNPGGHYDGTFVADFEYIKGAGSLDECNGRFTVTPEFPNGTYAYFLTDEFPVIPRCYKGTPSTDFTQQRRR